MKKSKYEKPLCLDASQVAAVQGASCSQGTGATDGCIGGVDPQTAPVCQPGLIATWSCATGTTNTLGNCRPGGDAAGCYSTGATP